MGFYDAEYLRLKQACGAEMPGLRTTLMALDSGTINAAGTMTGGPILTTGTAAGTIPANRLVKAHTDATLLVGTLASKRIIGVNAGAAVLVTETVTLGVGYVTGVAAEPIIAGDSLKCGDNGRLLVLADADHLSTVIGTGTAGNFGNQPANDGVEVGSASAADTTQTVTIIGTTQATDTVVVETVTLTGTTFVSTTKVDWGFILAVKLSASCAGTITIREASANAAITTITTGILQAGVVVIDAASQGCHGLIPAIAAAAASTKVVGVLYEPATGAADAYMAEALAGTAVTALPVAANRIKEIFLGDVATGTVATVTSAASEDDEQLKIGKAVASIATAASGTILLMPV
jgi:hypothetical protein